ncbi:MAG: peptide ABC transporter substrate-binding protein [Chloroflexaceae bacterium]|nr:peptide ABC transporter substrate-binding protein [Chloroflexaceae bacterium]
MHGGGTPPPHRGCADDGRSHRSTGSNIGGNASTEGSNASTDGGDIPRTPHPAGATPVVTRSAQGGTLKLLLWQAPTILNPHLARGSKDYFASRIICEPLASYDQHGTLVPFLAADIPSLGNGDVAADGTWVIWHLKPGVTWSDGRPFTADDVLFTYEFISNPANAATSGAQYDLVEQVEVVDDHTVKVVFKEPNPAWSLPFVGPRGLIIPRPGVAPATTAVSPTQEVAEVGAEAPANPMMVGTGPYRVVSFVPGDTIVYEANPYFREPGKPFFSRVELKGGGDATLAARAVLQTGEVDFAENLQVEAQVLDQLQQTATSGQVITVSRPLVEHILINQTDPNRETSDGERSSTQFPHPFFSDKRVRQAFAYAMDRETIATQLYGANGRPTSNILVEPPIYRSPNTSYEYRLDQAAALLDEAGWVDHDGDGIRDKDGVIMHVLFQTATGSVRQKTQEIVKQSLEAIGVEVELKSIDSAAFFDNDPANPDTYSHFYADLQMFTIPYDSPDPGAYMQGWICDEITQKVNDWSANNVERWCNPAYDALYAQATREMDPEQRRQLFIQMNDLLVEDVALIPLVHRTRVSGVSNSLEGVELTPWDESVWNIQDWRRR